MQALDSALQNGAEWLDASETHSLVTINVVDGVFTLYLFLEREFPGNVRFRLDGEKQKYLPIAKFICEVFPSLALQIEQIEMKKYSKESDGKRNRIDETRFETAPNERQIKEREDLAKCEDLQRKLLEKLQPIWREVANGSRDTTWTSGQSTDCLNYFCQWLILVEPTGSKGQFFLDASAPEIVQELDTNYLDYTDPITDPSGDPASTEYYLKGSDFLDHMLLARFRERWTSQLTTAPSGGGGT